VIIRTIFRADGDPDQTAVTGKSGCPRKGQIGASFEDQVAGAHLRDLARRPKQAMTGRASINFILSPALTRLNAASDITVSTGLR
jgi:hypothetical protein